MKKYRIEYRGGAVAAISMGVIQIFLCFTIIGIPIALMILPTCYTIVEESELLP
jgi:hypothetical protein